MTMMAARKFDVPEQAVVEALVGHWPIVRLRDGAFRELMEALPDARDDARLRAEPGRGHRVGRHVRRLLRDRARSSTSRPTPSTCTSSTPRSAPSSPSRSGATTPSIATHSFQFFDHAGNAAFKAFLWEDFPDVPADRIEAFHRLTQQFSRPESLPFPS